MIDFHVYPMYISLILGFISILILYVWLKNRRLPPGPYGLPIVGYLPFIDPKRPYVTLTELSKKYGLIYGLYLGNVYTIVLSDNKLIRKVFAKDVTTGRAPLYLTHGIMKGYGLICSEGDLWKDQRKFAINCLRQFGIVKNGKRNEQFETVLINEIDNFISFINVHNEANELMMDIDVLEPLRHSIGSIMNRLVFGKIWNRHDKTWQWLQQLQEEGTKLIGVAGPLNFLPFLRFIPKFRKTLAFLLGGKHKTHKVYQQIIKEKETYLKENPAKICNNFIEAFITERQKKRDDENLQNFYNDQQFYHLLADLFGAGLDTTLTTLRWYLLYMSINEDFQLKLHEELDAILDNRRVTIEDIKNLPLLEASIAETQRIRTVIPTGIPHGCLEDTEIDGYLIPKNTMIIPLQWSVHMNENIWHEPNKFNPLRFINEECRYVKSECLMPYQTGKRMCIGDEFARTLLLLFSARILQTFHVTIKDEGTIDLNGDCGITLTPPDHRLIFNKRRYLN